LLKAPHFSLIFRASEHEFKANSFYKICDNVTPTFTIIRTSFSKTIAGYTPLKWKKGEGQCAADHSG
jgi:hypothetical protein